MLSTHTMLFVKYISTLKIQYGEERTVQSSVFSKMHSEFSQEENKGERYKGRKSQIGSSQCPWHPPTQPPQPMCPFTVAKPCRIKSHPAKASGRIGFKGRVERGGGTGTCLIHSGSSVFGENTVQGHAWRSEHDCSHLSSLISQQVWQWNAWGTLRAWTIKERFD